MIFAFSTTKNPDQVPFVCDGPQFTIALPDTTSAASLLEAYVSLKDHPRENLKIVWINSTASSAKMHYNSVEAFLTAGNSIAWRAF